MFVQAGGYNFQQLKQHADLYKDCTFRKLYTNWISDPLLNLETETIFLLCAEIQNATLPAIFNQKLIKMMVASQVWKKN